MYRRQKYAHRRPREGTVEYASSRKQIDRNHVRLSFRRNIARERNRPAGFRLTTRDRVGTPPC